MFQPSRDNNYAGELAGALSNLPYGGLITFDEIEEILGFDVRKKPNVLKRAFALFNQETGAVMVSMRKVGYTRLTEDQYAAAIAAKRGQVRRLSLRTVKTFTRAMNAANGMSSPERINAGRELAMMGLIAHMSRDNIIKRVQQGAKPPSHTEVVRATLAAMNKGGGDAISE